MNQIHNFFISFMSHLTSEQKVQEQQYNVPYHWFLNEADFRGRSYFGYCKGALMYAEKYGFKPETMSALDAGCGDARFTKILIDRGVSSVEGLDYSPQALAFAKVFLPDVNFIVDDLTSESFSTEAKYDTVFLIETLEHIHQDLVPVFIKNLSSCLKTSGLLVVTVPSTRLKIHPKHYQHFTSESLAASVSGHFKALEIVGYNTVQHSFLSVIYKLIHNRFYEIIPLRRWFNTVVWPKYQCLGPAPAGRGLLMVAQKIND